jgi:hypothetical protein
VRQDDSVKLTSFYVSRVSTAGTGCSATAAAVRLSRDTVMQAIDGAVKLVVARVQ